MKTIIVNSGRGYGRVYCEMEKMNIEIFELEEKLKKANMYVALYYKKVKELDRIKQMLKVLYENSNDYVRSEIKKIIEEMEGIRYE